MSKIRLPVLTILLVLSAGCMASRHVGFAQEDLDKMGLELAWESPYGEPLTVKDVYLFKNVVIVRQEDDTLEALGRTSGLSQWIVNLVEPIIGEPYEYERFIYIVAGRSVYEFDQLSGFSRNKFTFKFVPTSGPVVSQKNIFISATESKVHCLSRLNGRHMWLKNARKPILFRPTITEGQVVFASLDLSIYSVNDTDGVQTWRFTDLDSPVAGPMAYRANRIYVTCRNGRVLAISRSRRKLYTRKVYWDWATDTEILEGPKLGRGVLFVRDADRNLHVFDITVGEGKKVEGPAWSEPNVERVAAAGKDFAYLVVDDKSSRRGRTLKKVDIRKGETVTQMKLPPLQLIAENTLSGEIFLVDDAGTVMLIKESNP